MLPLRFESERLLMRRFRVADQEDVFAYASDPRVTRFMDWPQHSDLAHATAFITATEEEWAAGQQYAWAIEEKSTSHLIGSLACSKPTHRVSLGYVLAAEAWGKGYATEATGKLLEVLRETTDVTRIWATCDTENSASARVLEKLGLECEGVLRSWSKRPNLPGRPIRDALVYACVAT